jgi:hypothetical protein
MDLLAGIDTRKRLTSHGGVILQHFPDDEKRVQNQIKIGPAI